MQPAPAYARILTERHAQHKMELITHSPRPLILLRAAIRPSSHPHKLYGARKLYTPHHALPPLLLLSPARAKRNDTQKWYTCRNPLRCYRALLWEASPHPGVKTQTQNANSMNTVAARTAPGVLPRMVAEKWVVLCLSDCKNASTHTSCTRAPTPAPPRSSHGRQELPPDAASVAVQAGVRGLQQPGCCRAVGR